MDDRKLIGKKESQKEYGSNESRMGLGSWRPDWLQRFNSISWFTCFLCLASWLQSKNHKY